MNAGDVVHAKVIRIETYGVYLEYNRETIVVFIHELEWIPSVDDSAKYTKVGNEHDVRVMRCLQVDGRRPDGTDYDYIGSMREVVPHDNPWYDPSIFAVGTRWTGMVIQPLYISDETREKCAIIVEILPGVRGVLKDNEYRSVQELAPGEHVDIEIVSIDLNRQTMEFVKL